MTAYRVHRRLTNGNLKPLGVVLGSSPRDARRRAARAGVGEPAEPLTLIALSDIHELQEETNG